MDEIKTITLDNQAYPHPLKKIANPPQILYIRGKILPQENCFAVVGTRLCSSYGKQVALEITGDLAEAGLVIVSGMAVGIDTWAHQAALERGRRTIAVLGTGLDDKSIYPQENLKLAHQIIQTGGCLISEFPPGTFGRKSNFPKRNRIIAGLSLATLVIEAKSRSGALITASWTKSQGKKVFAVPGPIFSSNSRGPHWLIKNNGLLVENAGDILKHFPVILATPGVARVGGGTLKENLILGALKEGSLHIDDIVKQTNLPVAKVCSILAIMEIEDKIRNLGGNIYSIKR